MGEIIADELPGLSKLPEISRIAKPGTLPRLLKLPGLGKNSSPLVGDGASGRA